MVCLTLAACYREKFGANATQDPLYQAISDGRRMSGMEHWLPLLDDRLVTLFDHLGEHDLVLRDAGANKALDARRDAIDDYYQNRVRAMQSEPGSYRPLKPDALYLAKEEWDASVQNRPVHLASPFPEPETDTTIDFGVEAARDFAPERAQQANVYEAVANHVAALRKKLGHPSWIETVRGVGLRLNVPE
jgi:transcription-repair coupling factor (superfamily II helicase)